MIPSRTYTAHSSYRGAGRVVVRCVIDDIDVDDVRTAEDPPAELLPLLSLVEAQEVLGVLGAVVHGRLPDFDTARWLLGNLAARVPSRE